MNTRGSTVFAWSLYELGATSFAMNLLSLHLPLDIAGRVPRVLVFFALANVAFQCAYVFYNALLTDVSDPSNSGRVSGFGVAAGYVGSLLGMFLVLPFVSGHIRLQMPHVLLPAIDALSVAPISSSVNDAWVCRNAYLPTALLWLAAAVPLLFFARLPKAEGPKSAARAPGIGDEEEKEREISSNEKEAAASSGAAGAAAADRRPLLPSKKSLTRSPAREVLNTIRSLPSTPSLLWFLASNFLYVDVIHTIQIASSP